MKTQNVVVGLLTVVFECLKEDMKWSMEWVKQDDDRVVPLRKDESTSEQPFLRTGVEGGSSVEAGLLTQNGDWELTITRVALLLTKAAKPLTRALRLLVRVPRRPLLEQKSVD